MREYQRISGRIRRKKTQDVLSQIKLDSGCVDCGYNNHPVALDFDHIDPSTKKFCISKGLSSRKLETVLKEVAKCEIRCANCHRIKSYQDRYGGHEPDMTLPPKRLAYGEDSGGAVLAEKQVVEILRRLSKGERQNALAKEYGVNNSTISCIARRKTWAHLETPNIPNQSNKGSRHAWSKLNENQVRSILKRSASGEKKQTHLAKEFGVSKATINDITRRRNWKHLEV